MFIDDLAIQDTAIPQPLRPPGLQVFTRRAERLRSLAQGHAMADFLHCCADIAHAQQACHDSLAEQAVNSTASLRDMLTQLHQTLGQVLGDASHSAVHCLLAMDDDALQALALALRTGTAAANPALQAGLPLLGAALQVQAVISARQRDLGRLQHSESAHCPVCHAPPVASLLRRGDSGHAVRYACCSQCASEWHVTRVKCLGCGNTRQLQYRSLAHRDAEPAAPNHKQPHQHRAVQEAECCDSCHGELKMVSTLLDAQAEPFADDLASLMLDMLAGEAGYGRIGVNPYFIAGEA